MVIVVISDDVKSNYHEGMEEAKEGSSAPGTHWSTGGREGGENIWRLENQGKKKLPKNFILFLTNTQLGHAPMNLMCRLLLGNSNTYLASKQQLHPPLVASRFKTFLWFLKVHLFSSE